MTEVIGYRVHTLGIQLTDNREIGLSGAFKRDTLWTKRVLVAECDEDSDYVTVEELPTSWKASSASRAALIVPDTLKRKPVVRSPAERCRAHLYSNHNCNCGVYAFKSLDKLCEQYHPDTFDDSRFVTVVTQGFGWGAIAEYHYGWRMQNYEIIGMTLIAGTDNPEEETQLVATSEIGRFTRANSVVEAKKLAEIPFHFLVSMLSGKYQCHVVLAENTLQMLIRG